MSFNIDAVIKELKANKEEKIALMNQASDIVNETWKEDASADMNRDSADEVLAEVNNNDYRKIDINDVKEAEKLRADFDVVDKLFSSDRILSFNDAKEMPVSLIDDLIKDKSIEEASAIITYFVANKASLSSLISEEKLVGFKESKERQDLVDEVKASLVKANAFTDWAEGLGDDLSALATDIKDGASELAESAADAIVEGTQQIGEVLSEVAEAVGYTALEIAEEAAEVIVDAAEAVVYVSAHTRVGVVRVVENCSDYVQAIALEATGHEEEAMEVLKNNYSDFLSEQIDEYFKPNDTLRSIGQCAEYLGEAATTVGLTVAAIAGIPAESTALSVAAGVAVGVLGVNAAGEVLKKDVAVSGDIGAREIASSVVAGTTTAAATAVGGVINGRITHGVARLVADYSVKHKVTEAVASRMVGALSSSAIAGTDVGLLRAADMATDLTNVALGFETDYDVVQELKDSLVSVGTSALLAGVGYDVFRTVRGSELYQTIFKKPYTPDYFDQVYREVLDLHEVELQIKIPEHWTEEQIAQAREKIEIMNQAELVKTPVERQGSASARYRSANGEGSILPGQDVDHSVELQLGGADDISNMRPIDSSVNRSFGSQINSQLRDVPYGTPVSNVKIIE